MTSQILECTEEHETQLETIRNLMLTVSFRGRWLTLAEIAEFTEFGEASISAQLRHLRKPRHGCYRVEKRSRHPAGRPLDDASKQGAALWEYRVLPPHAALPSHATGEPIQDKGELDSLEEPRNSHA